MLCTDCPRACGVERGKNMGVCGAGETPLVARAMPHFWEEPPISGKRGSGAVFFSGCPLGCVFCQNHDISQRPCGEPMDKFALAALILSFQEQGAHNVNLVTPTPHRRVIMDALALARERGLSLPVIYNTSGYETLDALKALRGLVDIYLPDVKYMDSGLSAAWSGAADYFAFAAPAVMEMRRQVGDLQLDAGGVAVRGLLIRHLALPGAPDDTRAVLDFIKRDLGTETHISLMRQYTPMHRAASFPPLDRRLSAREYARAVDYALSLGFTHLYIQSKDSADTAFTPVFRQSPE